VEDCANPNPLIPRGRLDRQTPKILYIYIYIEDRGTVMHIADVGITSNIDYQTILCCYKELLKLESY
jgi:hypothetical protein